MKKKLKYAFIGTLILYFTLSALQLTQPSLFTLFLISAVVVAIGAKKLKPIIVIAVVFFGSMIFLGGSAESMEATMRALFNLIIIVGISVVSFMWVAKKQYRLFFGK